MISGKRLKLSEPRSSVWQKHASRLSHRAVVQIKQDDTYAKVQGEAEPSVHFLPFQITFSEFRNAFTQKKRH